MKEMLIGYCGKKEIQEDPIAGTGLVWGPGVSHWVSESQGIILCAHTDSWECLDTRNPDPGKASVPPASKKADKPEEDPYANVNLDVMTKNGLAKFAQSNFGVRLDEAGKKDALLHQVKNLINANKR